MKASISSLTLHGWNSVSVQVLRGSDMDPWKLSLGPSNHTIYATTQNSSPASSFTEKMGSITILFIIIIDNNTYSMPQSSPQRKIIARDPHREALYNKFHHLHAIH